MSFSHHRALGARGCRTLTQVTHPIAPPTPNLPTKIIPIEIRRRKLSGTFPMGLRISPLNIEILLESNPLKSRILVRRLAVSACSQRLEALLSEGGMICLETLIELRFLNSSVLELIHLLKLNKKLPVEQFEATASQSTVLPPSLSPYIRESRILAPVRPRIQAAGLQRLKPPDCACFSRPANPRISLPSKQYLSLSLYIYIYIICPPSHS